MKYFKILNGTNFIGAVHSGQFVAENSMHKLYYANELKGQYISYKGKLYRSPWMAPVTNSREYEEVGIEEISEEEYNTLISAIDNNEEIIIEDDDEELPVIIPPEETDITLEFVRESKINEMSYNCRHLIEAGFDLELRGEAHHFSLTTQDQLNLMSLSVLAQTQSLIPYHADGEECTFYTSDEINTIVKTATELKIYNTTYFNALKEYINSLETVEEISAITYGTPIPEEYKSDVLKILE